MSDNYTNSFYDLIRSGSQSSAMVITPVIYSLIKPKRVIDIGCGEGWWAHEFTKFGCEATGVDGEYVASSPLGANFIPKDISKPFTLTLPADLVICLEVAEHLFEKRAVGFVADLVKLGPTILFSAAIPRQSGVHHVNCQWPSYWQAIFAEHGYQMSGSIRDRFWDDNRIEPWYRQNLMIVTSTPDLYPELFPDTTQLDRVHPVIQGWWS